MATLTSNERNILNELETWANGYKPTTDSDLIPILESLVTKGKAFKTGSHYLAKSTWKYKGVTICRTARNSSGMRWSAEARDGTPLRADTKQSMRDLISEYADGSRDKE